MTLLVVVIAACGGGGGTSTTQPKVVIDWPSLNRGISAPSYAKSATISLLATNATNPTVWIADRPAGDGSQTVTYPGPATAKNTAATLNVTFKSDLNGAGTTVATASVNVQVSTDGTILNASGGNLGTVSYSTALTGLTVNAPDVYIEESKPVVVSGLSAAGVVALPQELVELTVTLGIPNVNIIDGNVKGVNEGNATVRATFESFAATDDLVVTLHVANHARYNFAARELAADLVHNKIWGTFGPTSAYPNSIVEIDGVTGEIGTPITVGTDPQAIGISADGTVAYVGLNADQKIRVVDLTTRTAGATLSYTQLDANTVPGYIRVNPTNKNEIAISVKSAQNGAPRGPYIVRTDGTAIAATVGTDSFLTLEWLNGTEIIRMTHSGSRSIAKYGVTATTLDQLQGVIAGQNLVGRLSFAPNSLMTTDDGRIFSSSNLDEVGMFSSPDSFLAVATDTTHNVAWGAVGWTTNPLRIRTFDYNTKNSTSLQILPMNHEAFLRLMRFGPSGLVVQSTNSIWVMPTAPGL